MDINYDELLAKYPARVQKDVERFTQFCALMEIELEPFQKLIVSEVFYGRNELFVLLPRGNGKTALFALFGLWHLLTHDRPMAYCAAANFAQAMLMLNQAKEFADRSPEIRSQLEFQRYAILVKGKRECGLFPIAADKGGGKHGLKPTLALVDELHAHKESDTYIALKTAMGKNPGAQMVTISTAGPDTYGVCGQFRAHALELPNVRSMGALTYVTSEEADYTFFEWACRETDDLTDPDVLKRANPASFVTREWLAQQIASPNVSAPEIAWFHANVWAADDASWITRLEWDGCFDEDATIPPGVPVVGGLDVGLYEDTTALVWAWRRDDGRYVVECEIWTPKGDGTPLLLSDFEDAIRARAERNTIRECAYDPRFAEGIAQNLMSEGIKMVKFGQGDGMMVPAQNITYQAIQQQKIAHNGDPDFTAQVLSAGLVTARSGGQRLDKGKNKRPMDAAVALTMAYSRASKLGKVSSRGLVSVFG